MKKFALLACLVAVASFTACSGETKQETTTTTESSTAPDAVATDSVRHAHMHESQGMVHNHEHSHPANDTSHHDQ